MAASAETAGQGFAECVPTEDVMPNWRAGELYGLARFDIDSQRDRGTWNVADSLPVPTPQARNAHHVTLAGISLADGCGWLTERTATKRTAVRLWQRVHPVG